MSEDGGEGFREADLSPEKMERQELTPNRSPLGPDFVDVGIQEEGNAGNSFQRSNGYEIVVNDESVHNPWNQDVKVPSMPEVYRSVEVEPNAPWWKILWTYIGPGALVAVGYMDPGNWSTDIAGGSQFGYSLLCVVVISSIIAMFLQYLAIKCGIATNRDLAQACRDSYPSWAVTILWLICETAIVATDLAEVIGSAVAMKLLFNLPLIAGVFVTAGDVLILLLLQGNNRVRYLETLVWVLVSVITVCFAIEMGLSDPEPIPLLSGLIPTASLFQNHDKLFLAAGIIGATVMPHNLFLHSSIVLTRKIPRDDNSMRQAIRYSTIDCNGSLLVALFVNSAILIVAASAFYAKGYRSIATLEEASSMLNPLLGSKAASVLFGIALLASGQNSTLTGTLAGQIVMEGFLNWKLNPIYRRLITRLIAIVPAVIAVSIGGNESVNQLLIISQVVLCFALPFAIIPLVHVTSSKEKMGVFANTTPTMCVAYFIGISLFALNLFVFV